VDYNNKSGKKLGYLKLKSRLRHWSVIVRGLPEAQSSKPIGLDSERVAVAVQNKYDTLGRNQIPVVQHSVGAILSEEPA
jgi:hypothetical protein